MIRLAIGFLAGLASGLLVAWWWLGADRARWLGVVDEADDMCPNCVTPWKCNGPHDFGDTYTRDLAAILEREQL